MVEARAHCRVALAGNPSDGYGGAALSLAIANFSAWAEVRSSATLEIVPAPGDAPTFETAGALVEHVRANGYYGGVRLIKAAVKRLADYAAECGAGFDDRAFTVAYGTDIPRGVGLGGSSAIVAATLLALTGFLELEVPRDSLPELVLSVETRELGIPAGLQDRMAQVLGGLVHFGGDRVSYGEGNGRPVQRLDPSLLPPLFAAYRAGDAEPSERFHSSLRRRFDAGEPRVVETMAELGRLAAEARDAVLAGNRAALGRAMDASFDARRRIAELDSRHVRMIEVARSRGAAANFAGSGGAVVVLPGDEGDAPALARAFEEAGCSFVRCLPAPGAG